MASPNPPPKASYDSVLSAGFWLRNRARVLGALLLCAIVLVAVLFFWHRSGSREEAAWNEVYEFLGPRGETSEIQFEGVIQGSSAEPWALFLSAQRAFAEEALDKAEGYVLRLKEEFPEHVLNMSSQGNEPRATRLLADIRAEKSWRSANEIPEANPRPPEDNWVTLSTALGDIRIGLYLKEAPVACGEFVKLLREIRATGGAIDEVTPGAYVVLRAQAAASSEGEEPKEAPEAVEGQPAAEPEKPAPATTEPSKVAQGIVPDRNLLSHYAGALSFMRNDDDLQDKSTKPRVALYVADSPWQDSSEVVFACVLEGLEQLQQVSQREQDEASGRLKEPLPITGVTESDVVKALP